MTHREDQEIRADILDSWFYDDRTRPALLQAPVDVRVREGVARVEGHVPSPKVRRRLEARARGVPGVIRVVGRIVTDEELVQEVTSALIDDARTRVFLPLVKSSLGHITLEGDVPDGNVSKAASKVATSVPGVTGVANRLRVARPDGSFAPGWLESALRLPLNWRGIFFL